MHGPGFLVVLVSLRQPNGGFAPWFRFTTNPKFDAEEVEVEEYATRARCVSGSTPIAYGNGAGDTCPCRTVERSIVAAGTGLGAPGIGKIETLWPRELTTATEIAG